jgi:outer membrane protein
MKLPIVTARHRACLAGLLLTIARTGLADDLLSAYREALLQDPVYLAARHTLAAAEQKLPQARAGLLPTLSITGGESRQRGQASFSDAPFEDRDVRSRNWSLQLTQPLFRPASWSAYSQADAQVRQAAAQFQLARQELILRLAQAYFDVILAEESVAVATAQHGAVEQQWTLAKRNFEVGMATVTDVHEAKSRLDLARAQNIAAGNELIVKQAELERIVGRPPAHLPTLNPAAALPTPEPARIDPWIEQAVAGNPLVAIQSAGVESLEHEVIRSRSGHAPTLDLNASYGTTFTSGSMTSPSDIPARSRAGQVGVQLTVPIWSGGAVAARVVEATANLDKARADLEAARRQAVTLVRQAFSGVTSGQAQVEALASAVTSSRNAVDANQVGYRIGTRINIDVLNAEQQLYATRRDLARTKLETLMHGLRLKAAVGVLEESDIVALNRLFADS